jgi:hypothetical protein
LNYIFAKPPPWLSVPKSPPTISGSFTRPSIKWGWIRYTATFFEARWRLEQPIDDFSYWIETNFDLPKLVADIRDIDIYVYNLWEIRTTLLHLMNQHLGDICDWAK